MIHLAFSANARYLDKIRPFAESVGAASPNTRNWLVCVECQPDYTIPNVTAVTITREQNAGAPSETESIQHGSFLQVIDCEPDDTIIYCDGDMIMQRPFTPDEVKALEAVTFDTFLTSWNAGPNQTLLDEAMRLKPRGTDEDMVTQWGDGIATAPCFNIGVAVATANTWQFIYEAYTELWGKACYSFGHQARQQWLVSHIITQGDFEWGILPYEFHTHAHFQLPPGTIMINNVACIHDRVICFRHKF